MKNRLVWRYAYGFAALAIAVAWLTATSAAQDYSGRWASEWPKTDFSKTSVDFADIFSGGPSKDGIPSIDDPIFVAVSDMTDLSPTEPVVGLTVNGDARAYPLRILTWHEIVNDVVGGIPVMITYCPLCNTAIAFDRRIEGRAVEFGTTGKLRKSNLIMYDRESESWWQQMVGEGIVGARTGMRLKALPTRLESWERFKARNPDGKVLTPNDPSMRSYGANPYVGYDGSSVPFLYTGDLPKDIAPMAYVVAVADQAWSLDLLRREGKIENGDLVLTWEPGQNSVLDTRAISEGRDIGNVIVQRRADNILEDISYDVTFAFVFYAFQPEGTLFR